MFSTAARARPLSIESANLGRRRCNVKHGRIRLFKRCLPEIKTKKTWAEVEPCSHIWTARLPANLEAGTHCIMVRVIDEYGREHHDHLCLEVIGTQAARAIIPGCSMPIIPATRTSTALFAVRARTNVE